MKSSCAAFAFASLLAVPHARAAACDTSSESSARAAYRAATGKPAPNECFSASHRFAGLFTVGQFAHDRGCIWTAVIYRCQVNPPHAAARAMAAAGWKVAAPAARLELMRAWIGEVEHRHIVAEQPASWPRASKPWHKFSATADGASTRVRFWEQEPAGMVPEQSYALEEISFDANGAPTPARELDRVAIPMRGG